MSKKKLFIKIAIFLMLMFVVLVLWMKSNYSKAREKIIAIDIGHGGNDPGKVSVDSVKEKDINLSIGLELEKELLARGYKVILTRRTDMNLADAASGNMKSSDMRNRVKLINDTHPDIMISIHQNSFSSASVKGPQVFYYDSSVEGAQFAELMQEQLNKGMEVEKPRQTKSNDNYYLLKRSGITAIIMECGFLSNEQEAELLCSQEYQEKLANHICKAICSYYNEL